MQKLNSKKSYSEIYEILNILGEEYIKKNPHQMYDLIDMERDKNYTPNLLQENGLLDETKMSQEAIALFAVLNVKYFMQNETEKQEFLNTLKDNEIKHQAELREKYNPDNIFKKDGNIVEQKMDENIENNPENLPMEVKKKKFFERLIGFIKKLWKKNK